MYPSSRVLNDGRGLDIAEQSELDEVSAEIAAVRSSKQNTLTAGDNILIVDNVISCGCDTVTYTEGENIDINDDVITVDNNPVFNTVVAGGSKFGGLESSALFGYSGFTSWADHALIQWNNGTTILNMKLGTEMLFRQGGTNTMAKFDNNNDFWITRNESLQKINDVLDNIVSAIPTYTAGANITIENDVITAATPQLAMVQVCAQEPLEILSVPNHVSGSYIGERTYSFIEKTFDVQLTLGQMVHFTATWSGYRSSPGKSITQLIVDPAPHGSRTYIGKTMTYFNNANTHQQSTMSCVWQVAGILTGNYSTSLEVRLQTRDDENTDQYKSDENDECTITMITLP